MVRGGLRTWSHPATIVAVVCTKAYFDGVPWKFGRSELEDEEGGEEEEEKERPKRWDWTCGWGWVWRVVKIGDECLGWWATG